MNLKIQGRFKRWPRGLPRVYDWMVGFRYLLVVFGFLWALFSFGLPSEMNSLARVASVIMGLSLSVWSWVDFNIQRPSLKEEVRSGVVPFLPPEAAVEILHRESMSYHEVYALLVWRVRAIDGEIARREGKTRSYSGE